MSNTLIICLGSPRSGLNLLAQCLRLLGLAPLTQHDQLATGINTLIFQDLGLSPQIAGPLPYGWEESPAASKARERINELLDALKTSNQLHYVSDPLLCRVLPVWLEVFQQKEIKTKFIHIIRHPWETALSLRTNHGIDLLKAHLKWFVYVRDIWLKCPSYNLITFDQILADPISTLVRVGTELDLTWPKDPYTASSLLLDFVQPSLKQHHASDLSVKEKATFQVYEILYQEIHRGQWFGINEGNAVAQHPSPKSDTPIDTARDVFSLQSRESGGPDLIESLLNVVGQYEKQVVIHRAEQERIVVEHGAPPLFTQIIFPYISEDGEVVESIPFVAEEWRHIVLPVPEPRLLRDKHVILKPLNTNGTVMISVLRLVDPASGEVLWETNTPQDFEVLELSGTVLRIPDLNNFILLVTGDEPCARLPLMENILDCPVVLEIWMRVSRDQKILHRSIGRPHEYTGKSSSNIIWLASYPRSGNTLLRVILNHNFGLKSYSIYNDLYDIGKSIEVSEAVGHQYMNWALFGEKKPVDFQPEDFCLLDSMRYKTQGLKLIKTHSSYHHGFEPDRVIYIFRDGRAALRSYASYKDNFSQSHHTLNDLFDELLCNGDSFAGLWSENLLSWLKHPNERILFLKYEDILSDSNKAFKEISRFLEIEPIRTDIISFEHLHSIDPYFFRKGEKKSWQDMLDNTRHALFWILNYDVMFAFGYDQDQHSICDMLNTKQKSILENSYKDGVSNERLMDYNQSLESSAEFIIKNVRKVSGENSKIISKRLISVHKQFTRFFELNAHVNHGYSWMDKWFKLLNDVLPASLDL